ncbi:MAG: hypothetical protein V1917_00005 [Candidatus Gottesmanbacteria bacterium]
MKQFWNTIIAFTLILMALCTPVAVMAAEKEAGATATLSAVGMKESISLNDRVTKLESYLKSKNSPLVGTAEHFVGEADRLGLDWKLVAAIAGIESYFGKLIPQNSYNAWGWAIYTGMRDGRHFNGWEDGITTVSEGLKNNYVNRGYVSVEQIGTKYAADPRWAWKVNHFMEEIENFKPRKTNQLAIAL